MSDESPPATSKRAANYEEEGIGAMSEEHPTEHLFTLLEQVVAPYPAGVVPVWARIGGTAFFPGGSGLWGTVAYQRLPPMPVGGVMVLGHNFDCETGFAKSLQRGEENLNGPTWRTICSVLRQASIALEQCFFTNAYMGLKAGSEPTGPFPGARDGDFVRRCQSFLVEQIGLQRPRLLLTLGKEVPPVLAPLAPELRVAWMGLRTLREIDALGVALVDTVHFPGVQQVTTVVALTHPANRAPNVLRRQYNGFEGDAAEEALLQDALKRAGPLGCGAAPPSRCGMFAGAASEIAKRAESSWTHSHNCVAWLSWREKRQPARVVADLHCWNALG